MLGLLLEDLLEDLNTLGFYYESLCLRDLRIYSSAFGGTVSYYHDRYGLERNAILYLNNGKLALIEMKLGRRQIEGGAHHLLELEQLIKSKRLKAPSFLMVLTGGEYAYRREDGEFVMPNACLRD